jgi:hypothetical protein
MEYLRQEHDQPLAIGHGTENRFRRSSSLTPTHVPRLALFRRGPISRRNVDVKQFAIISCYHYVHARQFPRHVVLIIG